MARLALLFVGTAGTVLAAAGCEPVAGPNTGERFRDCAECPEMVVVPAGSFLMGSAASEKERNGNEGLVHRVGIAAPFAIGVYEVTFAQWDACEEDGGCRRHSWNEVEVGRGEGRPVVSVSWDDAQAYVRWLSAKTGKRYRLPSESEWEYAARAGTRTSRPWGDSESGQCLYANGADAAVKRRSRTWEAETVASCDDGRTLTAPVGRYEANAWGLHDVLGNVWEWTRDCWNGSYAGAPRDGSAWNSGDCSRHVLRGGSWGSVPRLLRSANRHGSISGDRSHDTGFRVARTLTAAEARLDEMPGQPFTVAVEPPGAEVRILDITAPYRAGMRLPAGNYRVEASAEGHETATETVSHGSSPTSHRLALRKLAAGRFRDCARCPEMVVVPAGSFLMGWRESEEGQDWPASALPMRRYYFPGPVHPVRIAAPFAVGVYEVTFSEWDACEEDGGCRGYSPNDRGWGRGQRPVINVNWADAQAYVQWLSEKTGERYRLPSESEWEYAARAGTRTLPPWGDNESERCRHANGEDSPKEVTPCDDGHAGTAPVGSYQANVWGLHDVLGNVWEWTEDCWHDSYAGAPGDGSAWKSGDCARRVARGGAYNGGLSGSFRVSSFHGPAGSMCANTGRCRSAGFRVARTLTQ